ncbi:unnamed protein product [Scytosiphon promiscuus]
MVSQRIAMTALAKVLPGLSFAAEETDEQAMVIGVPQAGIDPDGFIGAEAYLALDPIDGTTNFACGGPDWGVAAAVVRRETGPTHGVLYLPGKGIVVEAAKGHGCRINGEPVRLRRGQVMKECLVAAEIGRFIPDDRLHRLLGLVNHSMGIRNLFSRFGQGRPREVEKMGDRCARRSWFLSRFMPTSFLHLYAQELVFHVSCPSAVETCSPIISDNHDRKPSMVRKNDILYNRTTSQQ